MLAASAFGPRFGHPIALGQAETPCPPGCVECDPLGSGGCRDVLVCPKPNGRWTLLDYKTGELIKADVGDEVFQQYSVTTLPAETACQDPRCAPYCEGEPAAPPADIDVPPGCQQMTSDEFNAISVEKRAAWEAAGKSTLDGICAVIVGPDGTAIDFRQHCWYPNGNQGQTSGTGGLRTPNISCEENWNRICGVSVADGGAQGHPACPGAAPSEEPKVEAAPAPPPTEGPTPIDTQAFTPRGGIPTVPLPPAFQPQPSAPAAAPASTGIVPCPDGPVPLRHWVHACAASKEPTPVADSGSDELLGFGVAGGALAVGVLALLVR